jgi:hypothetical protein
MYILWILYNPNFMQREQKLVGKELGELGNYLIRKNPALIICGMVATHACTNVGRALYERLYSARTEFFMPSL